MASLATTYDELREEVAYDLGWGRDPEKWSDEKVLTLASVLRNGLRRFVFEAVVPQTRKVYEWTFLRQTWSFATVDGVTSYLLPSDFGRADGEYLIFEETDVAYTPAPVVSEAIVQEKLARYPTEEGPPCLVAVRFTKDGGGQGQRKELLVYPTPDDAYAVRIGFQVEPEALSSSLLNPKGGAPHARTLILACKAEGQKIVNNELLHEADYQMSLMASINYDSQHRGTNLGYNGDPSSERPERGQTGYYVTFDGTQY